MFALILETNIQQNDFRLDYVHFHRHYAVVRPQGK